MRKTCHPVQHNGSLMFLNWRSIAERMKLFRVLATQALPVTGMNELLFIQRVCHKGFKSYAITSWEDANQWQTLYIVTGTFFCNSKKIKHLLNQIWQNRFLFIHRHLVCIRLASYSSHNNLNTPISLHIIQVHTCQWCFQCYQASKLIKPSLNRSQGQVKSSP